MKIRWIPTLITAVLTACLLVGGWYVYRNMATVRPLQTIVSQIPGVKAAKPVISRDSVTLKLMLDKNADVRQVYDRITTDGASVIGSRELHLQIQEEGDQSKLDQVWSSMLFDVAQAMDHRNYSDIPSAMNRVQQQFNGVKATSEMDNVNVYITLRDGNAVKHIVLPRTPDQLGAWPDA